MNSGLELGRISTGQVSRGSPFAGRRGRTSRRQSFDGVSAVGCGGVGGRRPSFRALPLRIRADGGGRRNDRAGNHDGRVGPGIRASGRGARRQADRRAHGHHPRSDRPAFHAGDRRPVSSSESGRSGRTDPVQSAAQPVSSRCRHRDSLDQRPAGNVGWKENLHRAMGRLLPARLDRGARLRGDWIRSHLSDLATISDRRRPADGSRPTYHPGRLVAKANSAHCMLQLALQGFGATLLPCFLGDRCPDLVRVGYLLPELDIGLWMLTHSDLRRSARVRAFMDFAGAELTKHRRAIEGEETGRNGMIGAQFAFSIVWFTSSRTAPRSF